jgi:hypothetical protein
MSDDDDTNEIEDAGATEAIMPDPFVLALELCRVASSAKAIEPALKKLRKVGRDIEAAEKKLAALTAQAERTKAALAEREAAIAARETEIARREEAFEASLHEARDELRGYFNNLTAEDKRVRFHIMASADLLSAYNPAIQDLPSWSAIAQMVGLPDDPPALEREVSQPPIDALSDTFADPSADRHGQQFLGTLTRNVSHHERGAP